jgi:VCBS repeat-containing protein
LSAIDLSDVDQSGGTLTVRLSTSTGGNLLASNGGGIAVTGSGTGVLSLTGTQADLNTFLNVASNIQYLHSTPNTFGDDADTLQVEVNDNGNTGTGGGSFVDLGTANVDISEVNDAPVILNGPAISVFSETNSGLTDSGTLAVSDVDQTDVVTSTVDLVAATGTGVSSLPASLDNATLQGFLSVSPTTILDGTQTNGTLTWNFDSGAEAFNFLASGETLVLTYLVSATDDAGTPLSDTETVTITITGTNDAPTLPLDVSVAVAEDTLLIGTFAGTDIDGDSITYSLAGTDAGLLDIDNSTGEVSFRAAPNFEAPSDSNGDNQYDFTVIATDNGTGNPSDSQNVTVQVTDVNDAPQVSRQTPVNVSAGQSIVISGNELSFADSEQTPSELQFLLTDEPQHGVLTLGGIPLSAGDSFTQSDVTAGLLSYSNLDPAASSELIIYDVIDGVGGATNGQSLRIDISINIPSGGTDDGEDTDDNENNEDSGDEENEGESNENDNEKVDNDSEGDADGSEANVSQPIVQSPLVASVESPEQFAARLASQQDLSVGDLLSAEILHEIEDEALAQQILIGISAERAAGQSMEKFDSDSDSSGSFARDAFGLWKQLEKFSRKADVDVDIRMSVGAITVLGTFGGILWAVRGGTLMAVAFAQLPSWNFVDPLPILDGYYRRKEEEEKEDLASFF